MDYTAYHIQTSTEWKDILIAFLGEMPFDTFQDTEQGLDAFVPTRDDGEGLEKRLNVLQAQYPFHYHKERIAAQNWNEVWESNFKAVSVPGFCGIRADFHPPFEGVRHEIVINPKMAFGTGHHATTFMVLSMMEHVPFEGKSVFDYGCGTGILAILADKMGAKDIEAIDIEEAAYQNTIENCQRNGTPGVRSHHGILEDLSPRTYDIILANINRNVILDSLKALYDRLAPGGILITSGYVAGDAELIAEAHETHGFWRKQTLEKDNWLATKAYRRY